MDTLGLMVGVVLFGLGILILARKAALNGNTAVFLTTLSGFALAGAGLALITLSWDAVPSPGVVVGALLGCMGGYLLFQRQLLAETLYGFYNRPRREGSLSWVDKRIAEPDRQLCLVIATLLALVVTVVGLVVAVVNAATV